MKRVAVIMGSDSDLPVVSGCAAKLDELGINYEMRVMSAHRTPADVAEFAQNAYKRDFGVIIAAAGKAAHLAGFIAANTTLPVIGIPIKASTFDGLDALLATVQMPSGWRRLAAVHRADALGRARGNGCRRRCGQRRDTCGSNAFACGTRTSRKA